jgi:predicted nucleic acid-binding protein
MIGPGPLVVDSSAAIAIVRDEPEGQRVAALLQSEAHDGRSLVVPAHFWLEVMNPLLRRYELSGEAVIEAMQLLDGLGFDEIGIDRPMVLATLDLAERHGLTTYDAMYLAVVFAIDGRLLTFDARLREAAGDRAVVIGGEPRSREAPAPYERQVTWPRYREVSAFLAKLRADALAGRG